MLKIRNSLVLMIAIFMIGCSKAQSSQVTSTTTIKSTPTQSSYPYPMQQPTIPTYNSTYPDPAGGNETSNILPTPINTVSQLVIPTPDNGNAVITGQLLTGGEQSKPLITTIYLASAVSASTSGSALTINPIQPSDPIAIQEVGTGRFMFTKVPPGQYALVVFTGAGEYPFKDGEGNQIIINVGPGEVKDLGIITIQ